MDVEFLKYLYEDGYYGVVVNQRFKIGVRHLQILYMFFASVVMGVIRGSLSIAILAVNDQSRRNDEYIQIHNWDPRTQGAVISSFFFGYALMLVPAELFLKRIGGRIIFTTMLLTNGCLCVAMPTIINKFDLQGGWIAVCNAHLLMGMAHGCFSSVNQSLLEAWLPASEKSRFSCFVFNGVQLGIIIAYPITSALTQTPLGWELIYYTLAMVTLSMAVIYGTLTASSPDDHQAVGDHEKEYIKESLICYRKKAISKPRSNILKTSQFWAVASAHTASSVIFVFFLSEIPAFLRIFKFSLKQSTLYSMLPFVSIWVVYLITSPTISWIYSFRIINYIFSVTYYRKIINCLGSLGVIIGLTIVPNIETEASTSVVIALTITLGLIGFQFSGFLRNFRDMTENFSGTIMTMSSMMSSLVGAVVPFITGAIVNSDEYNMHRWRAVFLTLACIYAMGNIIYTIFGSNDKQNWDDIGVRKQWRYLHLNAIDAPTTHLEEFNILKSNENDTAF